MTDQRSYNKLENEVVHQYRRNVAAAESMEDVKKHFARTVCDLLVRASGEKVRCRHEDVSLRPDDAAHYALSEEVTAQPAFQAIWKDSDLSAILTRLVEPAVHRHVHLSKHPEKTNAKMYHNQ